MTLSSSAKNVQSTHLGAGAKVATVHPYRSGHERVLAEMWLARMRSHAVDLELEPDSSLVASDRRAQCRLCSERDDSCVSADAQSPSADRCAKCRWLTCNQHLIDIVPTCEQEFSEIVCP
eukprot:COSAG02_NODE_258_length_26815_cov_12.034998_4_plen_120_part_00